jgi:hypothetical protein
MRRVVALAAAACALVAAQPAAADVPKRGELRVLVALVTWGPQPATPAEVQTELARVAPWFDETSFSQLRVIAETTPGWLTIPPVSGCASLDPTLHDTADAALRGAAFDLARYDVRAYLFPRVADCPFGGRASLVAGWMELNGAFRGELIVHELAHSLGLFHSRATPCTVWSGACQVDEYGDPYDVMGDGFGPFNGFHKLRLGWIRRTSVERDGTYSVDQLERPSSSAQVLTIETAAAHYVVDHREASLEPMPVTPDPSNGVLVYRWNGDQGPVLLSAGGSPRQYLLPIGRTYEVPDVFSVTPTARVGTSVDVRFAWTDRTPPGAPTPVEPRNGVRVRNGDEPILMWDDALETGSGLGGYELTVDGVTHPLPVSETSWKQGAFPLGAHSWSVTAVDRAGNRTTSNRMSFVVEKLSPAVAILFGAQRCGATFAARCRLRGGTFGFTVETAEAPVRARVTVRLARRDGGWRTVFSRRRLLDDVGDAAFTRLPALRPGLWRVTADVGGNAEVSPASRAAYVQLSAQ